MPPRPLLKPFSGWGAHERRMVCAFFLKAANSSSTACFSAFTSLSSRSKSLARLFHRLLLASKNPRRFFTALVPGFGRLTFRFPLGAAPLKKLHSFPGRTPIPFAPFCIRRCHWLKCSSLQGSRPPPAETISADLSSPDKPCFFLTQGTYTTPLQLPTLLTPSPSFITPGLPRLYKARH